MKKKALGFAVLAMTLMASTAAWAVGGVGDIVSIDPCDEYGYKIVSPGANNTLSAGQTAYFRIRLLNVNCRISYNTRNSLKRTSPWLPDYNDLAMTEEQKMAMWASDPPYIGVYVSGSLRYASVLYPNPLGVEQDDDGSWAGWYTDLICSYTVKPGDLALPMTLANANGKEVGNGTSSQYWFKTRAGSSVWRLRADERNGESDADWNTVTETQYCLFAFNNGSVDLPTTYTPEWATDYNLKQAGLYLKSVDYHQLEYSVAQGRTEKVTVDILGGANTNGNGTVFVMTKDLDAIELAESVVETVTITSDPARPLDGTYQVAKVTIPSGDDATEFSFKVKGVEKDKSGTVYLSTTKTFTYGLSGDLVTNFVTAVVKCIEPPPPYITVTIDGAASKSVTPAANYTDYSAKLTVTLSEAYTADMTVNVTPTMVSGSSDDPMGKYIGVSTYSENGQGESTKSVSFTAAEMASGTLSKELYIYALGGGDDTDGLGKGIKFTPAATGAAASFFKNENVTATLYIKKSTPVVVNPVEGYAYSGLSGGVSSAFTIKISDSYNDLLNSYTVEWYKTGSGSAQTFTATPNGDGEVTVNVKYNAGDYTSRFRVKNASGVWSEMRTVSVKVNPAKQVSAVVEEPNGSLSYDEYDENADDLTMELTIRFKLTEGYDDSTLYAFLVPQDEASSNLVVCKAFTQGVAISSGDMESTGVARMTILDGNDDSLPLTYDILLRTAKTLSAGETIGTYEAKPLEIFINNKAPIVTEVNMSGSAPVTVSGGTFGGKASLGLDKIFTLAAKDVDADLTNDVTSVWTFSDPNGNATTKTVTAPLDDIVLTNVFEVVGNYTCTVKLQDKDMGKKYGPVFTFHVNVLDTPSVMIVFPDSEIYSEMAVLNRQNPFFYVDLSTPATKPVDVDLVCTKVGVDGIFNIATNRVSFRANQTRATVNIEELDGTSSSYSTLGGFTLTATVITETLNEDGIAYKDVYLPATERVFVNNEDPKILLPRDTGVTNDAAVNVNLPIKWKIDDVPNDLTNGLTVAWTTSEGRYEEFSGSDVSEGVFTNMFTSGGAKTVTITVTDKDGGSSSVTLYYRVAASKRANIYPQGPYYGGGLSAVAKKYAEADGRGRGRVWADATKYVEDFVHRYTYGYTATKADVYAWGYKNGQVDDGTLVDSTGKTGRDIAINGFGDSFANGATFTSANCYKYVDPEGRDSFFYAWVIDSKEEEASSFTGSVLLSPNSPEYPNRFTSYSLSLPEEFAGDDNNPVFPDRYLEAFFSKELYVEDNMGDMNADGIPDYFATKGWPLDDGNSQMICEAMTGQSVSSEGGDEGGGSASDLADVRGYNGDLDFLPVCFSDPNPLKPTECNWGPNRKLGEEGKEPNPFTAQYEIRGVGVSRGLNPDDDHLGLNEPGVSDYDLSSAERYALFAEYVKTGATLTGVLADDYDAATNWATRTRWTPEALNPKTGARLNPLKADTDGDEFDDGWEYFFWYYARIGAITNDVWGRLEGRRFDPSSPATGTRISSDEIAAAFNPHVVAVGGRDFDGDGLTDFEEYVLGTNPCDWDSDGDSMSDLYEVMNGLNPLSHDRDANPDYDFMAWCDYKDDTFTVFTFENGKMFGLPTATLPSATVVASDVTQDVYKVELVDGSVAWLDKAPVVIHRWRLDASGILQLAVDCTGYDSYVHSDGTLYLGAARTFAAGTPVSSVAVSAEPMTQAYVATSGFGWTDPQTLEAGSTAKALPLFNYGGDGHTLVPCTTNGVTYRVSVPLSGNGRSPLVRVETNRTVTLIHNQVFNQFGFDPRTAWAMDDDYPTFVDQRWRNSVATRENVTAAGLAANTRPYTSRDEYLVMQYRQQAGLIGFGGNTASYLSSATTYPNRPVADAKTWAQSHETKRRFAPFEDTANEDISSSITSSYWDEYLVSFSVHGADTDFDGVPDGWELYVGANPNITEDGKSNDDGDDLTLWEEYAGVDSCNAYTDHYVNGELVCPEATTITQNNPGKGSGWWNKFFPTNPHSDDTDGDEISDSAEGLGWTFAFYVRSSLYSPVKSSFIYGRDENAAAYELDAETICFRGGGLNPCTVDTDGDLLPDAWERQFAGIIFTDGQAINDISLSENDFTTVTSADGKQKAVSASGSEIRGGMDGTWGPYNDTSRGGDPCLDFDHDGLLNCQEYLVQSLRHLRYDDGSTPLMGLDPESKKFIKFLPFSAWDGEAFHKKCLEAGFTGLPSWKFRELGYFARPPHEWDMLSLNRAGIASCANYADSEGAGYRVMLHPMVEVPLLGTRKAGGYATTDPRRWDSDEDGMDDYYELFHGLNPLLGSAANPLENGEYDWPNNRFDVIAQIYGRIPNAWCNRWTGWNTDTQPAFDALRHPWMIGTMECDADGDGLRNDQEAIKANLAAPSNTHTDPTPLWMTDSSGAASFTAQYYDADPYISASTVGSALDSFPDVWGFPWRDMTWFLRIAGMGWAGASRNWMFAFEENEGYDTDHDYKRDTTELTRGVESTSDPLLFSDPDHRQALYLPGFANGYGSAALSRDGEFRRAVSTEPDFLKQFTVECWVKPDGAPADAVIVERVCNYGASTLSNNTAALRTNFRIGVDGSGNVYGEFEGNTVDSGTVRVTGPALEDATWTHVAFTFDGANARLYLNDGMAPVASASGLGLIPANGVDGIRQEFGTTALPLTGYRVLPCVTVFGAKLVGATSIALDEEASWDDFGSYFKGWIDEVRIWDGARSSTQIKADAGKRYSFDDVAALRETVYAAWKRGATRSATDGTDVLPAELLQHYNFTTLPGGVTEGNVITEPPGFQRAVFDNVRKTNSESIDELLQAGWWYKTPVHSEVYRNYAVIPWIGNTVSHLPFMDGSAPDSQYWSRYAVGVLGVTEDDTAFDFPNTANPYPYYIYRHDRNSRYSRLTGTPSLVVKDENGEYLARRYEFQMRSDFVGTSDLVPLGGAFAKRGTDFWDGNGSMDAWTETKDSAAGADDSDENGIPDWAEALGYTTVEAYLRALANGLLPDGTIDDAYKSITDVNYDGVKDWWQKLYGLKGSATSDADMDGLADYAEYLVSEVFKFGDIDPTKAMTNGKEFDYFRKVGQLYLGELFADHDFMEDWWENLFDNDVVSAAFYDPKGDADGDGWSNYAECRAGTRPDKTASLVLDDGELPEYPVPMIKVKAFCADAANISAPIIVQAYSTSRAADATWTVPGSATSVSQERLLGMNNGKTMSINLGPGATIEGSVRVFFRDQNEALHAANGGYVYSQPLASEWRIGMMELAKTEASYAPLGLFEGWGGVDFDSGEVTLDLYKVPRYLYVSDSGVWSYSQPSASNSYTRINVPSSYVKVTWQSQRISNESQWEFVLSKADVGHVREGLNTFTAFADLNGDGVYTAGEPFGAVRNVEIGWSESTLEIELTNESPICPRPAIATAGTGEDSGSESAQAALSSHIYVYTYAVDEDRPPSALDYGPILDKEIASRTFLNESDFLTDADFDIDWSGFRSKITGNWNFSGYPVTSVTYRVYFQPVNIDVEAGKLSGAAPYLEFHREFGESRATAVPVSPGEGSSVFYGARPTFTWRMTGDRTDTYTAFAIQVKNASGVVWNSGTQMAPPRNVNGDYQWTAPLYAGDQTALGKVFANTNNYTWSVTMYNSKFQTDAWSEERAFRMNVYAADEPNAAGYCRLNAAVKYFGPGSVNTDATKANGTLRVEAYTTPDFSGEPAGRTFVRDLASVTNREHEVNATIAGLKPGTYYVLAFIDSDGDVKRSEWESWGYACPRGEVETRAIFAPSAVTVGEGLPTPLVRVYVEDCDTDQDCLPDAWEYDSKTGSKENFLVAKGPVANAHNGYIAVNPDLATAISDLINGGGPSLRLLAAAPGRISSNVAALLLGVPTVDPTIDEKTLAITSLALADGVVTLTLGAAAEDPAAGAAWLDSDGIVHATVVVSYADALDGEWHSVEKDIEKKIEDGAVSEELSFSLSELGLDASKGFFKVELKK